jgi:hypothetical protein
LKGTYKGQPKIPLKIFKDHRKDGALFALASRIHQIKKLRDIVIDFSDPKRRREVHSLGFNSFIAGNSQTCIYTSVSNRIPASWNNQNLEVYLNCRRELERLNFIRAPKVLIDPSCEHQDQSRMRETISRLGGQIASGPGMYIALSRSVSL